MASVDFPSRIESLESSISLLDASFNRIELWLFAATALVVIGLVVEYWDDVRKLAHRLRRKRPIPWHLVKAVVGGVLVTIGVAWELVEEVNAFGVEGKLRDDSHQVETLLTAVAKDSMGLISVETEKAESERLARVKLEAEVAPRRLSQAQQDKLVTALAAYSGKTVSVTTYALDVDSALLAQQIIGVLTRAGAKPINQIASEMPLGGFKIGIHVTSPDTDLAIGLAQPIHDIGKIDVIVDSSPSPNPKAEPDGTAASAVSVLIGPKPLK